MICPHCGKDTDAARVGPTLDEVTAEVEERMYGVEPAKFKDFYDSRDWKRKDGSPIEDWRKQLRVWEAMDKKRKNEAEPF